MATEIYPELQYRVVQILVAEILVAERDASEDNSDVLNVIAPFVHSVHLLPTLYNTDLDLPGFKTLAAKFGAANYAELDHSLCGVLAYHGTGWNGHRLPIIDSEVEEVFQLYRKRAEGDSKLIQNGELEQVWTALFRKFRHPINLDLPAFIYNYPLTPRDLIDDGGSYTIIVRDSSSSNYNHFLGTVVRSITAAGINLTAIHIDYEMVLAYSGWDSDAWSQLRLNALTALRFRSSQLWDEDYGVFDRDNAIGIVIWQFLAKRPLGLTFFEMERHFYRPQIMAPSFRIFELMNLETICLCGVCISVRLLAQDINEMPALKGIYLRNCKPPGTGRLWKPIFDAIHFHSKPMSVEFEDCGPHNNIDFKFPSLEPTTFDENSTRMSNGKDLFRYLANYGPWTTEFQDLYG